CQRGSTFSAEALASGGFGAALRTTAREWCAAIFAKFLIRLIFVPAVGAPHRLLRKSQPNGRFVALNAGLRLPAAGQRLRTRAAQTFDNDPALPGFRLVLRLRDPNGVTFGG